MKRNKIFLILGLLLMCSSGYSQVALSDNGTADPNDASILDLQSTSKGLLIPRMTEAQKNAIFEPPKGLMIFQTDVAAGFYYNAGTFSSPDWKQITDEDSSSGSSSPWTISENNIYFTGGNVGIGTTNPGVMLDVGGPGWFKDSIAIDGSPGGLYINAATSFEPTIRLAQNDATIFRLVSRNPDGTLIEPYFMLNSNVHEDVWGVTKWGRVRQDYKGNYQAYLLYSSAPRSAFFIDSDNLNEEARCINATLSNTSADVNSIAIGSWNNGDGSAIYGANQKFNNFGYLGTDIYAVYGGNGNGFWGAIGTATSAVYGRLGDGATAQTLTGGEFAVKGIGVETSSQNGAAFAYNSTLGGVIGHNPAGSQYSFGVAGYTQTANNEKSGGVFGSLADASIWGSLAYRATGGTRYAGYFTSTTFGTGSGKAMTGTYSSIGLGAWGDLIGANIHGNVYGLYTEGENYSLYANGDVYRSGADVHIQSNASGDNSVMYTLVSTDMVVQTYGIGQMQKGKSSISFDQAFADVVSSEEPIIVTITPIGKSKGVYLDEVDVTGFSVGENDNGKSNVQYSWIAIGKRKGYENKVLPEEVIASDYTEKMHRGLSNDNNPEASAEGLYYQDGKLHNGHAQNPKTGIPEKYTAPETKKAPREQEIVDNNEVDGEK